MVFGAGAYGHAASGTLETVQTISRDDVVKFYGEYYAPQDAAFILVGDLTLAQGQRLCRKILRRLEGRRSCA